jgi:hypothetical protein
MNTYSYLSLDPGEDENNTNDVEEWISFATKNM